LATCFATFQEESGSVPGCGVTGKPSGVLVGIG
jgi:hypothetical protein